MTEQTPDGDASSAPAVPAAAAPPAAPSRFRIDLGYVGTDFHGWAAQPSLRTVRGCARRGVRHSLRGSGCAWSSREGRTQASTRGGQVVHCDLRPDALAHLTGRGKKRTREPARSVLVSRLRGVLRHLGAPDLVIHGRRRCPAEFDVLAVWRRYSYRIADDEALRDPLAAQHTVVHRGDARPRRDGGGRLRGAGAP